MILFEDFTLAAMSFTARAASVWVFALGTSVGPGAVYRPHSQSIVRSSFPLYRRRRDHGFASSAPRVEMALPRMSTAAWTLYPTTPDPRPLVAIERASGSVSDVC